MDEPYLAKIAKALSSGRRFSDSDPTYLSDVTNLISQGLYNNATDQQREEQQKIEAYLKVYGDKPDVIPKLLEFLQQNDWQRPQQAKAWY